MLIEIPLSNVPSKIYKMLLNDQECTIKLYQKGKNMFFDLQVGAEQICTGAICLNLVPIIQNSNPHFTGNFVFVDIFGDTAPYFEGLNERYFLVYVTDIQKYTKLIQHTITF